MTRKTITRPYPNDRRRIGEKYEPQGKFKIYEPNTTTPNIELEFKDYPSNFGRSDYAEPKMVRQTRLGTEKIQKIQKNINIKMMCFGIVLFVCCGCKI